MVSAPPDTKTAAADRAVAEIIAAIQAADYERAARLADSVLALGRHHPVVYNARALAFQQKGQFREALAEFSRARGLAPNDTNLANAIGICLINLNQPLEAIRAFDSAIALAPQNVHAHYRKGWTLQMLGEREEAQKCFERAIAIDPNHAESLASLASVIAVSGNAREATPFADRALSIDPNQPTAIVAKGIVDLEDKDFASAESRFRSVIDSPQLTFRARAVVHGLLADALDGQDRVDEAFSAYRFEKNEFRKLYAPNYVEQMRPREVANRISTFLEGIPAGGWSATAGDAVSEGRPARHVFLLGFPRSGTTLLEQVLASHPQVRAIEERDFLADMAQNYLTSEAGLRKMASLGPPEIAAHRADYWKRVREYGSNVEGMVFVDKLPMHTVKLPLIARLFPDARIIFALRDPRDVILSCFRRHFEINAAMFEFLTLDDAVELYASVMRLAAVSREKLPLAVHEHRYEDMIADFDRATAATCEFMGIEWTSALRDFHANETLLPVHSPSAAQIRRPLNADSLGAWRRYRDHLVPILPMLGPWIEHFGYSAR